MMEAQTFGAVPAIAMLVFALALYFFSRALDKAGFSPWWALLGVAPLVNLILLWVFAFARWPALAER
jgi:hypothetical protein